MSSEALNALCDATGAEVGPELPVAVAQLPVHRLDNLVERILTESSATNGTAPPRTQVWPVVTIRASTFVSGSIYRDAAGPAGLNLNAALNPRLAGTGRFPNGVLRTLLYCHGLMIEDPIMAAAEMYQGTSPELRQVAHLAVTAATTSVIEIAPLLDADVITTFFTPSSSQGPVQALGAAIASRLAEPGAAYSTADVWDAFEASYVDGLTPPLQQLGRRVRSGDRSPPLELVEQGLAEGDVDLVSTFVEVLKDLRPQAVMDNAADMVASTVLAVEGLGGFYDLLCPSPLFAKLLFLGAADPAHELNLYELGRVGVPGIDRLRIDDAVRIRQASEAFALWRSQLSDALAYAHELRQREGPEADTTAAVSELIADARSSLYREAKRSRLLTSKNGMMFVAGALGGTIAGALGGPMGMAFGAAGGALGQLVQAVLASKRVPGYLDRHYLVFEKDQE